MHLNSPCLCSHTCMYVCVYLCVCEFIFVNEIFERITEWVSECVHLSLYVLYMDSENVAGRLEGIRAIVAYSNGGTFICFDVKATTKCIHICVCVHTMITLFSFFSLSPSFYHYHSSFFILFRYEYEVQTFFFLFFFHSFSFVTSFNTTELGSVGRFCCQYCVAAFFGIISV